MTLPTRNDVLVRSFTRRSGHAASSGPARSGTDAGELGWSLRLLGSTAIRVSLFRFACPDLDSDVARRAAERAFGAQGVVDVLADGAVGLLLIGADGNDEALTARVIAGLRQALDEIGGRACQARFDVSALHRSACEIGDPDDFLALLSLMPPIDPAAGTTPAAA